MAKRMGFIVDINRCIGCHTCEMACKNEYQLDPKVRWRKVYEINEDSYAVPERSYMSLACNHCEKPECLRVCPVKAYTTREDGIVMHDQKRCIGCKMCMMACPYEVPQYNEEKKKVEKCHMCAEKLDKGEETACVAACPAEALSTVDLEEYYRFGLSMTLPGFPDPDITKSSTRFIKFKNGIQVRRDQ